MQLRSLWHVCTFPQGYESHDKFMKLHAFQQSLVIVRFACIKLLHTVRFLVLQKDSWAIDYQATLNTLEVAQETGAKHFVLLSAICVQKPLLEFQHAKLKFEEALQSAQGITHSIVRPTAFFKSLAGQVLSIVDTETHLSWKTVSLLLRLLPCVHDVAWSCISKCAMH